MMFWIMGEWSTSSHVPASLIAASSSRMAKCHLSHSGPTSASWREGESGRLGSAWLVALCHDLFPQIRKGTQGKSDLAQPPGPALSHPAPAADGAWFTDDSL